MKFDSKPVHGENDKYIPTKIKYMWIVCIKPLKVKKMPKEKVSFKYLSIIILYSVVKVKKKKKTLLKDCKYEPNKIKIAKLINDDLEKSLSDESDNNSNDEIESDNEKDNDESNE